MSAALASPTDGRGPWMRYVCRACGLVYDEGEGDQDSGLAPGTRFADIPDDWECPICGVTKGDFDPYVRREPTAAPSSPVPRRRGTGLVIIGGGSAGWSVAEAVRELDAVVPVTLVTACAGDVYSKPELSVALTRGLSPGTLRRETGASAAARLDVRLLAHTDAVGLSPAVRRLRTTRGTLRFADLVLAQGSRPTLPANLPAALCWRINDLRSWTGLSTQLAGGTRRVVVIGAGMIGCELAEDIHRAGHAVTLLARSRWPLNRLLPAHAGRRLADGLAATGIAFRGGAQVRGVDATATGGRRVMLEDGTVIEADIVVAALGLATPSRLVSGAGLAFDQGVVVDPATLRTSAPHVYALGDCASVGGAPCRFIEPISRQAEAIAHAVLGLVHPGYVHVPPTIRLKTRSAPVVMHGSPGPGEWRIVEDGPDRLLMEQWRDGAVAVRLAA